ncbi:MAG: tRNA (N(6)-L-threonylcarbamoyladenosine(37)-C(2))-methylthiotransferase MtaB [Hoeflea sp.]|uniref:tRNA (N(6)-L-threonylcarbamoyladenosine(37)-C(2))- methylthiotransferase MtaB n=1 Tax=Hoeflea sp. TaxID=1940281 RepID=UPI001D2C7324|nr:tRNA (N(6)-L-threonylcarbamoyladenosine(37)-C(2))-methylthiotransferase MtaB [Hoeflea sp.]MBU4529818.1 tRNA (N(6)-L-threonylcarbamoyladenosine(37)-C(2))-methylthiotransferase MtaB [Alphaproteobacteria bacterium]MBU4547161.1 tRNA (N(6)-L-threonylcarbamoyladenosine(37)-C(2))-methylthiotransferase MtaB [Alphaproteobacteria bacterium]MBU4548774.1 tRNA (N(6)-L-threonylcarbamoyladenosine(37)-C(2))-methylthiotransferase MtaB [Alphaproteobacteria bacterium]MBV1722310.1 tRNA (N(6)-L-threonylcarbamoyl
MSGVRVLTFGCRLNTFESETMRTAAETAGLNNAVLVNTCAVTADAVRQARQAIRRARREHPHARIVVSGCAAQTEPESFAEMAEVDAVIGNDLKGRVSTYSKLLDFGVAESEKIRVNDIMAVRETAPQMIDAVEGHARAFVQVQNGCDHRCTFCVIPFGRGNSRSVPMGAVVDQIARLVDNGYHEVVITGVDATSYGADLPGKPSLGTLTATILRQVPELARLRLSSIDSIEVDDQLMDLIANEPRFMPHLHLSLQHGDDLILKRMKRRHGRNDAIRFCETVRSLRPGFAFGADLIAGFPTETEEMFARSLDIIDECGIAFAHVFPYSPRAGTPAARMPQLDRSLVKARAARLREKAAQAQDAHLARMAQERDTHQVLVEFSGMSRTENFTPVVAQDAPRGQMALIRITGRETNHLTGDLVEQAADDIRPAFATG